MKKVVTIIREISVIEEELSSAVSGVLGFLNNEEKIIQAGCTFLYYHKNVYAVLNEGEDILEKIVYDTNVSFTILKVDKPKNNKSLEFKPLYRVFSASLRGVLKKPEETKITDEIKELYYHKYTGNRNIDENDTPLHFVMLDTVEITAFEEVGG